MPSAMHLQSGVSSKLWTNASSEQYGWYHLEQQLHMLCCAVCSGMVFWFATGTESTGEARD